MQIYGKTAVFLFLNGIMWDGRRSKDGHVPTCRQNETLLTFSTWYSSVIIRLRQISVHELCVTVDRAPESYGILPNCCISSLCKEAEDVYVLKDC